MKPDHPNHANIYHVPRRIMTETLITKFSSDVIPLVQNGQIDPINYYQGLKLIHTESVRKAISQQADNAVLGLPAHRINP